MFNQSTSQEPPCHLIPPNGAHSYDFGKHSNNSGRCVPISRKCRLHRDTLSRPGPKNSGCNSALFPPMPTLTNIPRRKIGYPGLSEQAPRRATRHWPASCISPQTDYQPWTLSTLWVSGQRQERRWGSSLRNAWRMAARGNDGRDAI